jgi:hypothetical protein
MEKYLHPKINDFVLILPPDLEKLCDKFHFGNLYDIVRDIDYIWDLFSNDCDLWDFLNFTLDLDTLDVTSEAQYLYLKLGEFIRELENKIGLKVELCSTYAFDGDGYDCDVNLPTFYFEVWGVYELTEPAQVIADYLTETEMLLF